MEQLQYLAPRTVDEAVSLLDKYGDEAKILAGGTDLIVAMRENIVSCRYLIDIKKIPEMQELSFNADRGLSIGGAVSLNEIINNEAVRKNYPVLIEAAKVLANNLLRNRATIIGNLCNASPAGDMLPASMVLEGVIEAISEKGRRVIPLKEFFTEVKRNALKPGELAVKVKYPRVRGKGIYLRRARIKGHDLSQIGAAGFLHEDGRLMLCIGSAAKTPVILDDLGCYKANELLESKVIQKIIDEAMDRINPITDQRATREYRIEMTKYLLRSVMTELAKEV